MALKEQIIEDMKRAMKGSDKLRLETLRTLRAALMEKEIDRRGTGQPMTAEDEIGVLSGAAKKRKESIEAFARGGREDLVAQEQSELAIIQEYLPRQISRDEVLAIVRGIIAETGAASQADFARVMPLAMKQLKGKTEGKLVQDVVKELLGGN